MFLSIFILLFQCCLCYINATGVLHGQDPTTGQWPMRQEINVLASQGKEMWDLYIQALLAFHNTSADDPLSYYQIAGIHGYPKGPWNNIGGSGVGGFCMHNSVLFPLWHRPYLALYEVSVFLENFDYLTEPANSIESCLGYRQPVSRHNSLRLSRCSKIIAHTVLGLGPGRWTTLSYDCRISTN